MFKSAKDLLQPSLEEKAAERKNAKISGSEGELSNLEKAEEAFAPAVEAEEADKEVIAKESVDSNLEIKEPTK